MPAKPGLPPAPSPMAAALTAWPHVRRWSSAPPPPRRLSIRRICPRRIFFRRRIMPPMKAASPPPRANSTARRLRSITPTRQRRCAADADARPRRSPAWFAVAPPIRAGLPARCGTVFAARPRSPRRSTRWRRSRIWPAPSKAITSTSITTRRSVTTTVRRFIEQANPEAAEMMRRRFQQMLDAGYWTTRRNSAIETIAIMPADAKAAS